MKGELVARFRGDTSLGFYSRQFGGAKSPGLDKSHPDANKARFAGKLPR